MPLKKQVRSNLKELTARATGLRRFARNDAVYVAVDVLSTEQDYFASLVMTPPWKRVIVNEVDTV